MSVLSAGDITKYNNAKRVWADPVLNVEPLVEVATADINQALIVYPITSLTVDNTSANWLDGNENMLYRIEKPDGAIISWGVLNYSSTADTFYPDVKSDGDFGYATNIGQVVEDDDIIRVFRNRPIWGMISRVTSTGIQNKRWSKTYTNEGSTPPPVCNMGHDQRQIVDTGTALATFSFDASNSYDWLDVYSISTYLYTLPSAAIVTAGSINTDSVTFTVPAGTYTIQCTITSTSGVSRSGFRTIYANDLVSNKSFGETYPIESIASDSTDIDGWEGQFVVLGDISSYIYPGAKCHFYAPVYYDGSRLTDNDAFIDVFVGYLTEINAAVDSDLVKRTTLSFKSPLKLAKLLPSATQTFEEVTSPSAWTQVIRGLSDPAYAAYYILQYHTTMLDIHDFLHETLIRDLRRRVFGFGADTISAHLQLDGQIMRGDIGCRSDGTISVTQIPSLQSDTIRDALDNKFTWDEGNVRDKLVIAPNFRPKIASLIMGAIAYDGNATGPMIAYAAKAPGKAQAQGVKKDNLPAISITVDGGAAELYAVVGHRFAFENNPLSKLDVPVRKMLDIGEPADPDWHTLDISESNYLPINMDKFGVRWSSVMRMRPTRVNRQWARTKGIWLKTVTQSNRIESFGRPGVFHPTYKGELASWINPLSGWLDGLSITMPDLNIDFDVAGLLPTSGSWDVGWAFNDVGVSGYSADWNGSNPSYTSAGESLDGTVVGQALDGSGDGSGYLITRTVAAAFSWQYNVYENPDVAADPTNWALDHSFTTGFIDTSIDVDHINIISNSSQTMIVVYQASRSYYQTKPADGVWSALTKINDMTHVGIDQTSSKIVGPLALDGTDAWAMAADLNNPPSIFEEQTVLVQIGISQTWVQLGLAPSGGAGNNHVKAIARNSSNTFVSRLISLTGITYLYIVDDATETWTDISPTVGGVVFSPELQNAIAVSGANIWTIAISPDGEKKLFTSINSGTSWTDRGEIKHDWLIRLSNDNVFVLGGDGLLDVTFNNFGTYHSRLGQWGSIGSIGQIKDFVSGGL